MTDPLNSPFSLRIGETTSRMLQREPSLRDSTARLLCSTRCLRPRSDRTRWRSSRRFPRRPARRPHRAERPSPRSEETPVSFSATGFMKVIAGRGVGADDGIADRVQGDAQALLLVGQHGGSKTARRSSVSLCVVMSVRLPIARISIARSRRARAPCRDRGSRSSGRPCAACGTRPRRTASCRPGGHGRPRQRPAVIRMDHGQPAVGVAVELASP